MKRFFAFVPAVLLSVQAFGNVQKGKLTIDPSVSKFEWSGTKKVAGAHNGEIGVKSGTVTMGDKTVTSAEIEIDMKTIKNLDVKDPKDQGKLVGHLSSPDFFDVAKFPTAKLVIVSGKDLGAGKHELKGKITIKDVTQDITVPVEVKKEGALTVASGKLSLDRTKFGVKYGSGNFFKLAADKIINDTIDLSFTVAAK